jgi:hypothetical protein
MIVSRMWARGHGRRSKVRRSVIFALVMRYEVNETNWPML